MEQQFWNRVYAFDRSPLPSRIEVGGKDILAAPASVRVICGGADEKWDEAEPFPSRRGEEGDTYAFSAQSEACRVILDASVRFESDGFVWYDLELMPYMGRPAQFDSLFLDIPLKTEYCELMNFCSMDSETPIKLRSSDYLPREGVTLPFVPSFWCGREDAGLGFYMESPENVILADRARMIETLPEGEITRLRVHLLDAVPARWMASADPWDNHSAPLSISFGIQATPVKKFVKPAGYERAVHGAVGNITNEVIDELPSLGAKYVIFHENWTGIQNYDACPDPAAFRALIDRCHARGIRALAYFGYEISTLYPDFKRDFRRFGCKYPHDHYRNVWQRTPPQRDFVVCYQSEYAQIQRRQIEAAMEEYALDGVYLDGTFIPQPCANESHGCGWRDEAENLHMSFPLLAYRDNARRIAEAVHARGGIVDAHTGGFCYAPILGFADSYWDGEAVQDAFRADIGGFFNFGTLRAQFTGVNWGVPSQFIVYTTPQVTYENISGLLLVCGVMGRPYGIENARKASKIWRELDDFGTEDAAFYPPWSENPGIEVSDDRICASCWIKGNTALAVLFNTQKEARKASVTCLGKTIEVEAAPQVPLLIRF